MPTVNAGYGDARDLWRFGPTVVVHIGYDPQWQPGRVLNIPPIDQPALIDTGATIGGIDSALAGELQLPIVDVREEAGVSGPALFNIHAAQVYIPALDQIFYGRLAGHHLSSGGFLHRALIGRSFLTSCTMHYDGRTGHVTISNE